jgi:hypothetical protein
MRQAQHQRLSVLHGVSQKLQEKDWQAGSSHRGCGTKPKNKTGETKRLEPTTIPEASGPGRSFEGVPHRIGVGKLGQRPGQVIGAERILIERRTIMSRIRPICSFCVQHERGKPKDQSEKRSRITKSE